jgi:hypothetical protein
MSFKDAALRIKRSPLNLEGEKNVTHRLEERSICELLRKFGNRVRQQLIQHSYRPTHVQTVCQSNAALIFIRCALTA